MYCEESICACVCVCVCLCLHRPICICLFSLKVYLSDLRFVEVTCGNKVKCLRCEVTDLC